MCRACQTPPHIALAGGLDQMPKAVCAVCAPGDALRTPKWGKLSQSEMYKQSAAKQCEVPLRISLDSGCFAEMSAASAVEQLPDDRAELKFW